MKKIIKAILIFIFLTIGFIVSSYFIVELKCKEKQYSNITDIPYNRVGLVLGTNPVTKSGKTNYYFKYRIDACVKLYKAKKISKILVSGDNHKKSYDEPEAMRKALIKRGIPQSAIVLDYAGFRTLDSVVRSKEVFGQNKITIISQGFHNSRAIYIASHYDIEVIGYNAKDIKNTTSYFIWGVGREALARTKMFLDLMLNKQPKFLGPKEKI